MSADELDDLFADDVSYATLLQELAGALVAARQVDDPEATRSEQLDILRDVAAVVRLRVSGIAGASDAGLPLELDDATGVLNDLLRNGWGHDLYRGDEGDCFLAASILEMKRITAEFAAGTDLEEAANVAIDAHVQNTNGARAIVAASGPYVELLGRVASAFRDPWFVLSDLGEAGNDGAQRAAIALLGARIAAQRDARRHAGPGWEQRLGVHDLVFAALEPRYGIMKDHGYWVQRTQLLADELIVDAHLRSVFDRIVEQVPTRVVAYENALIAPREVTAGYSHVRRLGLVFAARYLARFLHEELLTTALESGDPSIATRTTTLERLISLGLPEMEPVVDW